jgi:predicted kinase
MTKTPGMLCFFCGRAGAGKSTLARQMATDRNAILICEDQWLVRLFVGAPTLELYLERRARIRNLLAEYVPPLLAAGHCVIFDFGGNTIRDRQWVRSVFESAGARHELHYLPADIALCKQRVAERNLAKPTGVYWGDVSEATLDAVNAYFQPPTAAEGFTIFEHPAP